MLIRIVSVSDGDLEHTEFEIDGKMFGGDVKAVTFSHDSTKPHGSGINIRMVYGDDKVWDSSSGESLPPIDDHDRHFDIVSDMLEQCCTGRSTPSDAPCPVVK